MKVRRRCRAGVSMMGVQGRRGKPADGECYQSGSRPAPPTLLSDSHARAAVKRPVSVRVSVPTWIISAGYRPSRRFQSGGKAAIRARVQWFEQGRG